MRRIFISVALLMSTFELYATEQNAIQLEEKRCAPYKEMITNFDAFIEKEFNPEVLDKKRSKAYTNGLISGGTGRAGSWAAANFDTSIAKAARENLDKRIEILTMIGKAGC
jgi:hypothetical protein